MTPYGTSTDTIIAIDFTEKNLLIGNSSYAGDMKKSVFTTLNFYLPAQGVMPMHCSANVGKDCDSALETARKLVRMFQENFVKFEQHVDVRSAALEVRIAAE